MENVGQVDIRNPWLYREGRDYSNIDAIVRSFTDETMSDREKVLSIFGAHTSHGIHAGIFDPTVTGKARHSSDDNDDIVRYFNIYG